MAARPTRCCARRSRSAAAGTTTALALRVSVNLSPRSLLDRDLPAPDRARCSTRCERRAGVRCSSRSPRAAPCRRGRGARACSTSCAAWASASRSTTSGRASRRSCSSSGCPSTRSRSTARSWPRWRTARATPRSCARTIDLGAQPRPPRHGRGRRDRGRAARSLARDGLQARPGLLPVPPAAGRTLRTRHPRDRHRPGVARHESRVAAAIARAAPRCSRAAAAAAPYVGVLPDVSCSTAAAVPSDAGRRARAPCASARAPLRRARSRASPPT